MGLFSKKTIVCERCRKEFQTRITLGIRICPECLEREAMKEANVKGYVDYASVMLWDSYTEEQLDQIAAHRDRILEKYRMTEGISREELRKASDNYRELTDDQAADILVRVSNSYVNCTTGASYTDCLFFPSAYERTAVDVEDVFAVGLTDNYQVKVEGHEVIVCAVFTNDPYIPAFPLVYLGKRGMFELLKSKSGRATLERMFLDMCPNLQYPVQELGKLKKEIKSEDKVRGAIELNAMLDMIFSAQCGSGQFNVKKMKDELPAPTVELLDQYGYIPDADIFRIMRMDKFFNRNFWNKQKERLLGDSD